MEKGAWRKRLVVGGCGVMDMGLVFWLTGGVSRQVKVPAPETARGVLRPPTRAASFLPS